MTAGNNTTRPIPAADVDEPISVAVNEFAPDRYHLNGPLVYSPPQIAAIVEAAGGLPVVKTTGAMDSLADTLRDLTWSLFFGRFHQKLPSPTWFKRKAQSIEKFSGGLAKSLEIQGNDPPNDPDRNLYVPATSIRSWCFRREFLTKEPRWLLAFL